MKKNYLLTGARFSGQVQLSYDNEGYLVSYTNDTNMTTEQREFLLRHLPYTLPRLEAFVQKLPNMVIRQAPTATDFDTFWEAYGKKVNRKRCEPMWAKLPENKKIACMMSLEPYHNFLRRHEGRAKLDPENYLKRYAWDNDWNSL